MAGGNVVALAGVRLADAGGVGGKNASLGEMIGALAQAGVRVPGGFATTADAYRKFLVEAGIVEFAAQTIAGADVDDADSLAKVGVAVRERFLNAPLPEDLSGDIRDAYRQLCADNGGGDVAVAVRSSATAEDLPDASFAGQQDTFLNVRGEEEVLVAVRKVFASLYNDRAIAYRRHRGYDGADIAMSAGVQLMVRSDLAASGVMFTLDTESGFEDVVFVTASYGLGESVVQGAVNPDEFYVYKPSIGKCAQPIIRRRLGSKAQKMIFAEGENAGVQTAAVSEQQQKQFCLTDEDVCALAEHAVAIEKHYGRAMDIEWGKDGDNGELYILQARPETVKSRATGGMVRYRLIKAGERLAEGRAIGQKIGVGAARVVAGAGEMNSVCAGDVLITDMTDPDWEPVMKKAAAIATRRGGRTCHAAIIARELGVPALVGCGDTLDNVANGARVTVSCAEGDTGFIYEGEAEFETEDVAEENTDAKLPVQLQMNVANPDLAFEFSRLPSDGVGLARLEFIITRGVGFHPRCALDYPNLPADVKKQVEELSAGYESPRACYVGRIAEGAATIAAAFAPRPVVVRLSDFKSNEYAGLVGGNLFEPPEENPMIGFRGAGRYVADAFRGCFELECEALRRVREQMALTNVWLMVPFVRTPTQADEVLALMAQNGIKRGEWKIVMMCEVPSNVILAGEFLERFDGFSIGSNDLTQLTLALDRDSELVADAFDERDPAVKEMISRAIAACRERGKYAGICGQAPSDHPEFAGWLMEQGINAISLNPDALAATRINLAKSGAKGD